MTDPATPADTQRMELVARIEQLETALREIEVNADGAGTVSKIAASVLASKPDEPKSRDTTVANTAEELDRLASFYRDDANHQLDVIVLRNAASLIRRLAGPIRPKSSDATRDWPVAWRVKDFADGWILCHSQNEADRQSRAHSGALIQPLYAAPAPAVGEGP